jgi:hypothetical protein
MDNGSRFPFRATAFPGFAPDEAMGGRGGLGPGVATPSNPVGSRGRQIRPGATLRGECKARERSQAVGIEAVPPRKASSKRVRVRTANRHRWAGRVDQGGRENPRQGTRQIGPVTSGEGAPR